MIFTDLPGLESQPDLSPDGRHVVYSSAAAGNLDVFLMRTDGGRAINLTASSPDDDEQAAFSPDGRRIAYWANRAGQRDLWTVGVDGGEPVAVTADLATDWSPEWSPDGRWLHFSSDRAGGMNLFRVAIDGATGGASGAPEQVTTSVGNLGWARFSADGRRQVAAAHERSAALHLYHLTPGAAPTLEPVRTLRSRNLHWCRLSPDAEWLACATIGTPEDLVLLRADGSELRRLTEHAFKDRNIAWSSDGTRLAFDSARSGEWNLWTLRADGSEPRRLTDFAEASAAIWRHDGKRVTVVVPGRGLGDVDADQFTAREAIRSIPLPDSLPAFLPGAWSPSGDLLGGTEVDPGLRALSIGVFDPATGTYRRSTLPMSGDGYWKFAGWLPDSRHFVAAGRGQMALVDASTGAWRGLLAVENPDPVVSLSRDASTLRVETGSADGDVWLLESPDAGN